MCGLTGYWNPAVPAVPADETAMQQLVAEMAACIHHRGPDAGGTWVDPAAGFALGHRRLAIVDLSAAGHQPMVSADGRFALAYNGEIYNADELKADLQKSGASFRGHSDTEVLLAACAAWGVEATVQRLIGMFAFALWDRAQRRLVLVRDRLGIKPMYWGRIDGTWFFGSQPKSFFPHPQWRAEIDRQAAADFLRFAYVPAPASIYRGLAQLRPGHMLTIGADGEALEHCYWDATALAAERQGQWAGLGDAEAIDRLEHLLADAVQRRMVADVPLGAFLSGGVDSSLVVALMQRQSASAVRSFSIGFHEQGYNEAQHAAKVAEHLGTEHTELYVDAGQALDLVPKLAEYYDEPFADSSQLPTQLISELTRRHVTVSLSGDGGDELFAGYNRYLMAGKLKRFFDLTPRSLRAGMAGAMRGLSPAAWETLFRLVPARRRLRLPADKMYKLAAVFAGADAASIYPSLVSFWPPETKLVRGAGPAAQLPAGRGLDPADGDFTADMQLLDLLTYLPDDILTKVDRASMAVSLEARVPLLDHRVVEFSWGLPMGMKLRDGRSKWLLRQVLYRHVPAALIERPKMGFGVPIDQWLRGPLRDWAEDLLAEPALRSDDLLDPTPIRRRWREHLSGQRNWHYSLWNVLMLQAWRQRWMSL